MIIPYSSNNINPLQISPCISPIPLSLPAYCYLPSFLLPINPCYPDDATVPTRENMGQGPGDVKLTSSDKMDADQVTQSCHHK